MRSKFLIILFLNFDLMIEVSTSWLILLDKFDLMSKLKIDLMIKNSISWSKIRSHEKIEFQSHEIRPSDPEPNKLGLIITYCTSSFISISQRSFPTANKTKSMKQLTHGNMMTPVENNIQTKISKKLLVSRGCISRLWFQAKFTGLKSSRFFQRNCFETKKRKRWRNGWVTH
jgi:hypothetical protein